MENSFEIPNWLQWIGIIFTIGSGVISALVLWQTSQLKSAFFLKAKLPKLYKKLGVYRAEFNEVLEKNSKNYNEMRIIQAKVTSMLKQAQPSLSKLDELEVKNAMYVLNQHIGGDENAWDFYRKLSALEIHIGESLEDLQWNN
jgi:hypothetical protein